MCSALHSEGCSVIPPGSITQQAIPTTNLRHPRDLRENYPPADYVDALIQPTFNSLPNLQIKFL
jgi:hypothetical protein